MRDTTEDHAAAIVERCKAGDIWGADLFAVADHATALAAERDALRAALREMTEEAQAMGDVLEEDFGKFPFDAKLNFPNGVAELMDADR